jgi:hypothetical protein
MNDLVAIDKNLICAAMEILYCLDPRKPSSRLVCRIQTNVNRTIALSRMIEGNMTPRSLAEALRDLAQAIERQQ